MGKSKNDSLTHEEIWDDSALVRSWEEAVEEYQLYHSINAKGENVEEVLKEAEESVTIQDTQDDDMEEEAVDEDEVMAATEPVAPTTEAEPEYEPKDEPPAPQKPAVTDQAAPAPAPAPAAPNPAQLSGTMPMPDAVMATVKDENLKRLMMSWYFAGYYTGLYEGQQQASQGTS